MIIRNCPTCVDIPNSNWDKHGCQQVEFWVAKSYCELYKCYCDEVKGCLIKDIKKKYNISELVEGDAE